MRVEIKMKKSTKNSKIKSTPIVSFFVRDNQPSPSRELFGTLRGWKKSGQQIKDEMRMLLHHEKYATKETFGILKGRVKISGQKAKDMLRKELYDD